jgi:hypothetical protein
VSVRHEYMGSVLSERTTVTVGGERGTVHRTQPCPGDGLVSVRGNLEESIGARNMVYGNDGNDLGTL